MKENIREKNSNCKKHNFKSTSGITLIALVITIIVLLILAGVSLSGVINDKGIFSRAESAGNKHNEAKAREVLEMVLAGDGVYEKYNNPEYNQDDFLDALIKSEIEGADVKGDIAIVGGYAFELDRSVPKIGRYLGLSKDLVFPTVDAIVKLAEDKKNATITITALEEKNGINKIEIWLLGEKIDEFPYDNVKTEITLPYTETQNGKYTIKAYGELWASKTVEVTGIMPEIEFEPNGNEEWKKEHSTKIKVKETKEKIKTMKYQWTNSVTEPEDNTFIEDCKDGDTISKNNVTGTYYLWVWLEIENGTTVKRRSEGFNFDNEGPKISEFKIVPESINTFSLICNATDSKSGVSHCTFFQNDTKFGTVSKDENLEMRHRWLYSESVDGTFSVVVEDNLGNTSSSKLTNSNEVNFWGKYTLKENNEAEFKGGQVVSNMYAEFGDNIEWSKKMEIERVGDSWKFVYPETGDYHNYHYSNGFYFKNGGSLVEVGPKSQNSSTLVWSCNYRYIDITWKTTYSKGNLVEYQIFSNSATNPTPGKSENYWYEFARHPKT